MSNASLRNLPVLDSHIHLDHPRLMSSLFEILDKNNVSKLNLVCTPHHQRLSLVPDALFVKAHDPDRVYVFGGLDISAFYMDPQHCGEYFSHYVDVLMEMGCDGIKMIEGKPTMRKMLPIPAFDSPAYTPYWEKMEARGVPLVFHVNDPEEFWDENQVPDWAKKEGWFYGDGSYINNEEQYTQVLNVLKRHPTLKVTFAHFFFLSAQLERLGSYFEQFPNMMVDLTPGVEMYHNFSKNPEKTRDFFLQYQDRIVFGTDIGASVLLGNSEDKMDSTDASQRIELIRRFLETDGAFRMEAAEGSLLGKFAIPLQCLGLPEDVLRKIYYQNFERMAGPQPHPLNAPRIVQECKRLQAVIPQMGAADPTQKADTSVAELVSKYFESYK